MAIIAFGGMLKPQSIVLVSRYEGPAAPIHVLSWPNGASNGPRSKIPFLKKGILLRGVKLGPLGLHVASSGVRFAFSQAVLKVALNIS